MNEQQPKFADVKGFVENYLGQIYQRQVSDSSDTVWCEQWWRHPEAAIRLDALWRGWEHLHRDERGGLSYWLLRHADPHMAKLFDPRGTFKYCGVRHGHVDRIEPLPVESPPAELMAGMAPAGPDFVYGNVVEFVEEYLAKVYRRQVVDVSGISWCPQWWRHPEAAVRLEALWRAWEYWRTKASIGLSTWFLEHADLQMAKLFDPNGPFKYCDARGGHQSNMNPLPLTAELEGMWTNPAPEDMGLPSAGRG
ncbi:DUF4913 domain-containing protein [Nocardia arizonensis]|uniref:DUF4913 domain-containing protein n=1 Tax=Nocardia arizonensis TaxID=1141647 RepID=UPI000AEC8D59|nr:DUF4913 domain-containing protein [Nocardia arizonensis]